MGVDQHIGATEPWPAAHLKQRVAQKAHGASAEGGWAPARRTILRRLGNTLGIMRDGHHPTARSSGAYGSSAARRQRGGRMGVATRSSNAGQSLTTAPQGASAEGGWKRLSASGIMQLATVLLPARAARRPARR